MAALDLACILVLYSIQGCVQGLAFGTLPMLLMRNPSATEHHQSRFSLVGYPFSLKFLLAPLVDGVYSSRIGRRESWLLPLQALSAVGLAYLATCIGPMLAKEPPDVGTLVGVVFLLVAAAAAGDIATDAWAAGRMSDSRASVCQLLGLTLGYEGSVTLFFLLKGRGLLEVEGLLTFTAALACGVLLLILLGRSRAAQEEEEAPMGVLEVLKRILSLAKGSANLRIFLAFLVAVPVASAHQSVLGVRYQRLGFTPELSADYDAYLLPLSFLVMWLAGKLAQLRRPLQLLGWVMLATGVLDGLQLLHFGSAGGEKAAEDRALRLAYVALGQAKGTLGTITFVVKVSCFNKLAQRQEAVAGTVITFLASVSNLGGQMPATWAPLVAEQVGLYPLAVGSMAAGCLVLCCFWPLFSRLEDPGHPGWGELRDVADRKAD